MTSEHNFQIGDRVRFTSDALGTITLDQPYRFTSVVVGVEDTGEIYSSPGAMPEGWLLVKIDEDRLRRIDPDWDGELFAPVDPRMIVSL